MISFSVLIALFIYVVTHFGVFFVWFFLNVAVFVWGLPSQALNRSCNSLLNRVQILAFILTCGQQKRTRCSSPGPPRRRVLRWYNLPAAAQGCLVCTAKNPARPSCQSMTCAARTKFAKSRRVFRTLIRLQRLTSLLLLIALSVRFYTANKIQLSAHFSSCCLSSEIIRLILMTSWLPWQWIAATNTELQACGLKITGCCRRQKAPRI